MPTAAGVDRSAVTRALHGTMTARAITKTASTPGMLVGPNP